MKKKHIRFWAAFAAVILVSIALLAVYVYLYDSSGVDRFLQRNINAASNKELTEEIRRMNLQKASDMQRRAVFEKLYDRVKKMNFQDQLAFADMGRGALKQKKDAQFKRNVELLIIEFWARQARDYMKMSPEERQAKLEQEVAREAALEAARQAKRMANQLMGKKVENQDARAARHAKDMINAASDALKSANTSDRAAAAQLFTDYSKARAKHGLPGAY